MRPNMMKWRDADFEMKMPHRNRYNDYIKLKKKKRWNNVQFYRFLGFPNIMCFKRNSHRHSKPLPSTTISSSYWLETAGSGPDLSMLYMFCLLFFSSIYCLTLIHSFASYCFHRNAAFCWLELHLLLFYFILFFLSIHLPLKKSQIHANQFWIGIFLAVQNIPILVIASTYTHTWS